MPIADRLIILDRDGVINHESATYIKTPEEWIPIKNSLEAIARLHQAGYRIAIVTNQSGIGRGLYDRSMLANIHQTMRDAIIAAGGRIDAIFYCPHLPTDHCHCRKPRVGLLQKVAGHFQRSIKQVPFIGDSWADIVAARTAGVCPLLVKTGWGETTIAQHGSELTDVPIYADLAEAVTAILKDK